MSNILIRDATQGRKLDAVMAAVASLTPSPLRSEIRGGPHDLVGGGELSLQANQTLHSSQPEAARDARAHTPDGLSPGSLLHVTPGAVSLEPSRRANGSDTAANWWKSGVAGHMETPTGKLPALHELSISGKCADSGGVGAWWDGVWNGACCWCTYDRRQGCGSRQLGPEVMKMSWA